MFVFGQENDLFSRSEFNDEIEKLVSQTFEEAKKIARESSDFLFEDEELSHASAPRIAPEETCGVLYHLQKNESTFVLRMMVCENLREDWGKVINSPNEYPALRLEGEVEEELRFFECDSIKLAKALKAQMANKRFPLHEERIINVSDPGDNWWLKKSDHGLSVYFKLCRTESMDTLIKAGPLGDCEGAMSLFNKLYGYFSLLFPLADYSSAHGQLYFSSKDPADAVFSDLQDLFLTGEMGNHLWEKLRSLEEEITDPKILESLRRANFFMMEIACMRSFWREVQALLS